MNKNENKELCKACGGLCCKKGGCQYSVDDFESLKFEYLYNKLQEGYISIVCALNFQVIKGKPVVNPILYVKARNVNRPIIDLLSMRTKCSALTEEGCLYDYEHRPSGGVNLVPKKNGQCYHEKSPMEYITMWKPYQTILRKLVKKISGKSVENQLKDNAYQLFKDIFNQNFEGVDKMEIKDVLNSLSDLAALYPTEFNRAYQENQERLAKISR
ncbi:MAG: hypothetical protein E7164_02825 [Firmicutes bacterium]|nr:hypothetical protein [Bacillota bacterium]